MASVICSILILGFSGMVAQIVLLRELLIVFSGNELSIGIFIALWVAGEAAGALLGERANRLTTAPERLFAVVTAAFAVLFPAALVLVRGWKMLCGVPPEFASGLATLSGIAALVMLPVALVHGFLFIAACGVVKNTHRYGDNAVGLTYSWEVIGSIIGGTLTGFVLLSRLNSFDSALLLALLNAVACALLPGRDRVYTSAAALFGLLAGLLLLSGQGKLLHDSSIARQWAGRNVVSDRNSPYQNIVMVESAGQYTLFADGSPQVTLPVPDIERVEELAHLTLLLHPEPRELLIIGGGAGGLITEILKHPSIARIDYLETDPLFLTSIAELPAEITGGELSHPKVRLITDDARVFLTTTGNRYDVVVINAPLPETLQANRFFTRQFFTSVRGVLNHGGLLAVTSTGSQTYYSPHLKSVNATLLATLKGVFPGVDLIPGDTNLFIAGTAPSAPPDVSLMLKRMNERGIKARLLTPEYLAYRLSDEELKWGAQLSPGEQTAGNDDFSPSLMYRNLTYRSRMHTNGLSNILDAAGRLKRAAAIGAVVVVMVAAALCTRNSRRVSLSLAVAGTGMSSMIGQLLLMAIFQVFYGSLFHLMGMLLALFMAGTGLGGYLATLQRVRRFSDRNIMITLECSMTALMLALTLFLALLEQHELTALRLPLLLSGIAVTGLLTGICYPVAGRLYGVAVDGGSLPGGGGVVTGAGVIYAVDLLGGCLGGVLGSMILLPTLGMKGSFLLLGVIKGGTAIAFARGWHRETM